jgi:hypothetical protein
MTAPFILKEGMSAQKRLTRTCFALQMLYALFSLKKKSIDCALPASKFSQLS